MPEANGATQTPRPINRINALDAVSADTSRVIKSSSERLAKDLASRDPFAHPTEQTTLSLPPGFEEALAAALAPVELERRETAARIAVAIAKDGLSAATWRRRRRWVLNVLGLTALIIAAGLALLKSIEAAAVHAPISPQIFGSIGGISVLTIGAWIVSRTRVRVATRWLLSRLKRVASQADRADDADATQSSEDPGPHGGGRA